MKRKLYEEDDELDPRDKEDVEEEEDTQNFRDFLKKKECDEEDRDEENCDEENDEENCDDENIYEKRKMRESLRRRKLHEEDDELEESAQLQLDLLQKIQPLLVNSNVAVLKQVLKRLESNSEE